MILKLACLIFFVAGSGKSANAAAAWTDDLGRMISKQLAQKIPAARITTPNLAGLGDKDPFSQIVSLQSARLMEERANGIVVFDLVATTEGGREIRQVVQTPFEAWVKVPVAMRRIFPNTKLKNEDFKIQEVNVASGMAREFRGVMLDPETELNNMESRQTILEGQFVIRPAVQRQPDVRKGEMVKLELMSGDLSLVTQAIVQEPASIGDKVHVLTLKTKKEIVGRVKADHSVEVSL